MRDGVTGGLRKLHNEELHNLYTFPSIIRIVKSRRMRCAGNVAQKGEEEESQRERDHCEDQDLGR
jgi:hypothetical protein